MQRIADRFRVVGQLGEGGMGAVLEVEHEVLAGRRYAAKVLRPQLRDDPVQVQRMFREARAAAAVDHPGIVGVQDILRDPALGPVLLMERLYGESLAQVGARQRLDPAQLRWVAVQALEVLGAAHAAGLVHRDVKPGNLFVEAGARGERIRLLDFGLVTEASHSDLTEPGMFMGTLRFASPEQISGEPVSAATDLYSLGMTLLSLATGETLSARLALAMADPAVRLAELPLPEDWRQVLGRALQPDAHRRFPDAEAMLAAISALDSGPAAPLLGGEQQARPVDSDFEATYARPGSDTTWTVDQAVEPPGLDPRGGRGRGLAAGVLLLALLGAGGLALLRSGEDERPGQVSCRELSAELMTRQREDGSFSGIQQVASGGWDTAQQLVALKAAQARCAVDARLVLQRGGEALRLQHLPGGWGSPGSDTPHTMATAWAVLATRDDDGGPLGDLLALQRPDGSFPTFAAIDADHPYATVMAAWALDHRHHPRAGPTLDWLAAAAAEPDDIHGIRGTPGLDEQVGWVLLQAGRDAPAGLADRVLARSALEAYPDGQLPFPHPEPRDARLITQGEPWGVLAAEALAGLDTTPRQTRQALLDLVDARRASWDAAAGPLRKQPGYVLAETILASVSQ